jgi:hypothetical protein
MGKIEQRFIDRRKLGSPKRLAQAAAADPKGLKYGRCNVTACQRPGAQYYNKSTRAYYCEDCAREINWPGGRADCMELFKTPLLCEYEA